MHNQPRCAHEGARPVAMGFGLRLSLILFAFETFTGLIQGKGSEDTILSALTLGGVFRGLGLLLGEAARQFMEELSESKSRNPRPILKNKTPSSTDNKCRESTGRP